MISRSLFTAMIDDHPNNGSFTAYVDTHYKKLHKQTIEMSEPDPDRHADECTCYGCVKFKDTRDYIYALPANRQQELYTWMHDILNLRRWK